MLIAGCGTGQHAIATPQLLRGARMLAVDLSLASLGYAQRKIAALGSSNIELAQADILQLGSIDRRFDLIESVGVLHHLEDPWRGWRVLRSLLRPGGFMRIGLYSKLARHNVNAARAFIARQGYRSTADDIRRCRQDLIALDQSTPLQQVIRTPDFFTTSACRDLLFHVQEHQMTLPEIKAFLAESGLSLLGLEIEPQVSEQYRRRFPQDPAMTDLDNWHAFETEKPETFFGMYQFTVQATR